MDTRGTTGRQTTSCSLASGSAAHYVARMPRFDTVLFDLDGTLIDSVRLILDSYHHTLRVHGFPPRTDAHWLAGLGIPLKQQFADWAGDEGLLAAMTATYRDYNLKHHDDAVKPYPGIVEVVIAVREAGCRTALVTSKSRQGAGRGLRLVGLDSTFDLLVCADDVERPKPHPEPVHRALRELDADVGRTLFVGDSVHDMKSGRAAGVTTGAVLWGPFGRDDLADTTPDYWLEEPEELRELVLGPED